MYYYCASRACILIRRVSTFVKSQAGQNEINIVRLPSVLLGDSIRVEARSPSSSSQHLTVFDVIHVPATYSYGSVSYEPGSALDTLHESKKTLKSRLVILKKQGQVLEGYSDGVKPVASEGGGVFPPAHLESFLDIYGTRQAQINEQTRSVEREINKTQKDIEALEKELRVEKEEQNSTSITVIMLAEEEGSAELLLTYSTSRILPTLRQLFMIYFSGQSSVMDQFVRYQSRHSPCRRQRSRDARCQTPV